MELLTLMLAIAPAALAGLYFLCLTGIRHGYYKTLGIPAGMLDLPPSRFNSMCLLILAAAILPFAFLAAFWIALPQMGEEQRALSWPLVFGSPLLGGMMSALAFTDIEPTLGKEFMKRVVPAMAIGAIAWGGIPMGLVLEDDLAYLEPYTMALMLPTAAGLIVAAAPSHGRSAALKDVHSPMLLVRNHNTPDEKEYWLITAGRSGLAVVINYNQCLLLKSDELTPARLYMKDPNVAKELDRLHPGPRAETIASPAQVRSADERKGHSADARLEADAQHDERRRDVQ